jgi:hypothetical protein
MFLTHEDWRIQDACADQLARPFHPWNCTTATSAEPIFLIALSLNRSSEEFRYAFVAGVEKFLELATAPGSRVESVSHLSLFGHGGTPRLEPLVELRRITPRWLPAQHRYMRVDGRWNALEPWPVDEVLPFDKQTVVFSLLNEDCY